jgi:plastocyanin
VAGAGGTGGAAGSAGADAGVLTLCGCTEAAATDLTSQSNVTITFISFEYQQPCIKVSAGTSVTWSGSFASHPLVPFSSLGTQPNPIPNNSSGTSASVTLSSAGGYGYRCGVHGAESESSGSMCGAVFVVP